MSPTATPICPPRHPRNAVYTCKSVEDDVQQPQNPSPRKFRASFQNVRYSRFVIVVALHIRSNLGPKFTSNTRRPSKNIRRGVKTNFASKTVGQLMLLLKFHRWRRCCDFRPSSVLVGKRRLEKDGCLRIGRWSSAGSDFTRGNCRCAGDAKIGEIASNWVKYVIINELYYITSHIILYHIIFYYVMRWNFKNWDKFVLLILVLFLVLNFSLGFCISKDPIFGKFSQRCHKRRYINLSTSEFTSPTRKRKHDGRGKNKPKIWKNGFEKGVGWRSTWIR